MIHVSKPFLIPDDTASSKHEWEWEIYLLNEKKYLAFLFKDLPIKQNIFLYYQEQTKNEVKQIRLSKATTNSVCENIPHHFHWSWYSFWVSFHTLFPLSCGEIHDYR